MPPVRRLSNTLGGWVFSAAVGRHVAGQPVRLPAHRPTADDRAARQRRVRLRVRGRDDRPLHRPRPADRLSPDPHDLRGRAQPHPAVAAPHRASCASAVTRGASCAASGLSASTDVGRPPRSTATSRRVGSRADCGVSVPTPWSSRSPSRSACSSSPPSSAWPVSTMRPPPSCSPSSASPSCVGRDRRSRPRSAHSSLYDFLFIEPHYTLTVHDPPEWLNLLLLLVVGVVVGRLAGRERDRAVAGDRGRARGAGAVQRQLHARHRARHRPRPVHDRPDGPRRDPGVAGLGRSWARRSRPTPAPPGSPLHRAAAVVHSTLRRRPGDEPAEWVRVHAPSAGAGRRPSDRAGERFPGGDHRRRRQPWVRIWAVRPASLGDPDDGETRVLAAAADQIGGSLERDRLQREATSAEISRRSDALKSALLDSVSHDLRTPLASIRAAAGTLMDPEIDWPADQRREIAASIDREADWLNRLVTNLLDMSRIEAGELRPNLGVVRPSRTSCAEVVRRSGVGRERPDRRDRRPRRPAAGPGRRSLHRPGPRQHARQRREVRRTRRADPGLRHDATDDRDPGHDRGRRARRSAGVRCRASSRSSTGSRARAKGRAAGPASASRSSAGSSTRWAGRVAARTSELGGLAVDLDLRSRRSNPTSRGLGRRARPREPHGGRLDPARRGR